MRGFWGGGEGERGEGGEGFFLPRDCSEAKFKFHFTCCNLVICSPFATILLFFFLHYFRIMT